MAMHPRELMFVFLVSVFVACMAFINIVSAKLWSFMGLTISAGIMAYWLTFPITDVVGEVYGKSRAQLIVWLGLGANLLVLGMTQLAILLPPAAAYNDQQELETILGSVPLVVVASLVAYITAQSHDVWAFSFWKKVTNGQYLWLRNNLSTFSSQLIDSVIFNAIAFWVFAPVKIEFLEFLSMTLGYWAFKVCIALFDTPLVYFLVHWIRRFEDRAHAAPN